MNEQRKSKALDIYRLLAMLLVMWGHLIGSGKNAYEVPGVINGTMPAPIIDPVNFKLAFLEDFLYYKLNTQPAVLGVVMFFICTGYLLPAMLQRYQRKEFLTNRFFRIYPVLAFTGLLWMAVVFVSQGIVFGEKQFLFSVTLLYQLFGTPPFMGLLWTLIIEVFFYVIAALWRKIDEDTIAAMYIIIILAGVVYHEFPNRHTFSLFYDLRYMGFILLGSAIYCAKHSKDSSAARKVVTVGLPFLCNLLIFQGARHLFGDETTYPNLFSSLIPLLVILGLLYLEKHYRAVFELIPNFIYRIPELSYCVYLSHICIGLTCMYWLSKMGLNRYFVVLAGFVSSFIVAKAVHLLVERPAARWSKKVISKMKDTGKMIL